MKALSWINFILGLWLIVAGFTLSAGSGAPMAEEIVLGIIIAVLAYSAAMTRAHAALSWLVAIAGLWTLVAPSFIGYGTLAASRSNDIIVGIIVLVLGFISAVWRRSPVRTNAA